MRKTSGNMILMLFGAVAVAGVLGTGYMATMKGPGRSLTESARSNQIENNMMAATKLVVSGDANQQDCDGDGTVEPTAFRTGAGPTGGGLVPLESGGVKTDPWGKPLGYCVWDHGKKSVSDNVGTCGGSGANRLQGGNVSTEVVLAIVSAGKDGIFQTTCNPWVDANNDKVADTPLIVTAPGSDDIVKRDTIESLLASGALAQLPNLPDDACIAGAEGTLRYSNGVPQVCTSTGWKEIGGATNSASNFTDVNNAPLSSVQTSNTITFSGFFGTRTATVNNGASIIVNGVDQGSSANIAPGDNVAIKATSSATGSTTTSYILKVASISRSWNVTTMEPCVSGSQTFNYTGSTQNFVVPANCDMLMVKAWGGGGGAAGNWNGGGGGYVAANLNATPGETLTVYVGGGGGIGAGGGASALLRGATPLLVAGAGGGAGTEIRDAHGGAGGGLEGDPGGNYPGICTTGSTGGTQSAPGAGSNCPRNSGSAGSGRNGGKGGGTHPSPAAAGWGYGIGGVRGYRSGDSEPGGGGGGYYGGGGGGVGNVGKSTGGSGGSSYISVAGENIGGAGPDPGNKADASRGTAGQGGLSGGTVAGQAGKVVLNWLDSVTSCGGPGYLIPNGSSGVFYNSTYHANCASIAINRTCINGTLDGNVSYQYASCNLPENCSLNGQDVNHGSSHVFYTSENNSNCASISQNRTCTNGVLSGSGTYQYPTCSEFFVEDKGGYFNPADTSSYSFNNIDIGAAATNRRIYVAVGVERGNPTAPSLSNVMIGSIAATQVATGTDDYVSAGIYYADVSSGSTATISYNVSTTVNRGFIYVWSVYGMTAQQDFATSNSGNPVLLDVTNGGVALVMHQDQSPRSPMTWTNATMLYDETDSGGSHFSAARYNATSTQSNYSIDTNGSSQSVTIGVSVR